MKNRHFCQFSIQILYVAWKKMANLFFHIWTLVVSPFNFLQFRDFIYSLRSFIKQKRKKTSSRINRSQGANNFLHFSGQHFGVFFFSNYFYFVWKFSKTYSIWANLSLKHCNQYFYWWNRYLLVRQWKFNLPFWKLMEWKDDLTSHE